MENKPTLEEVKEHFKNAEEVKCLWTKQNANITKNIFKEMYKNCSGDVWIVIDEHIGGGVLLYNEITSEYAEILTYKEKTFSITESQIKELYSYAGANNQHNLESWFKEVFKIDFKGIEIGNWVKHKTGTLVFRTGESSGYGFDHKGNYENESNNWSFGSHPKKWREATESEVFEALKNEAVKRGFVGNQYIDISNLGFCNNELITGGQFEFKDGWLNFGDKKTAIFKDGVWGSVLASITKSEAEKQLNKKIID